jgi:hypothetical protein
LQLNRLLILCSLLVASSTLSGCGTPEQQAASNAARAEVEVAHQALKGLPPNSKYTMMADQVDAQAKTLNQIESPVEMNLRKALETPNLPPGDTAFITYELARSLLHQGKLADSEATFRKAIQLAEAMNPRPKDLLQASYRSFSACLNRAGKTEEAKKYDRMASDLVVSAKVAPDSASARD